MRRETKKGVVCVCVCVCAEEEARFHEVTISLSVERGTGVGRGRVSGVISRRVSWIRDAFGAPPSRLPDERYYAPTPERGFPCGEFP